MTQHPMVFFRFSGQVHISFLKFYTMLRTLQAQKMKKKIHYRFRLGHKIRHQACTGVWGVRERGTREDFENMDCEVRHLQCISGGGYNPLVPPPGSDVVTFPNISQMPGTLVSDNYSDLGQSQHWTLSIFASRWQEIRNQSSFLPHFWQGNGFTASVTHYGCTTAQVKQSSS